MNSFLKILQWLYDNWATIVGCIVLILAIYKKTVSFMAKSNEEQLQIAKKQISQTILKLVSEAEEDYGEYVKAGEIKRAEVIDKLYETYPILSEVVCQEEIIKFIDDAIDKALDKLRDILKQNA